MIRDNPFKEYGYVDCAIIDDIFKYGLAKSKMFAAKEDIITDIQTEAGLVNKEDVGIIVNQLVNRGFISITENALETGKTAYIRNEPHPIQFDGKQIEDLLEDRFAELISDKTYGKIVKKYADALNQEVISKKTNETSKLDMRPTILYFKRGFSKAIVAKDLIIPLVHMFYNLEKNKDEIEKILKNHKF